MRLLTTSISAPIEFISGGEFYSEVPWTHSSRVIDSFEIIIGHKETLYLEQEGIKYEIKPGDILLLYPGHSHEGFRKCLEGISFGWLHFTCPAPIEIIERDDYLDGLSVVESSIYIPQYSSPIAIERINILFQQIQHLIRSNYYSPQGLNYFMTSMLIEMSEQYLSREHQAKNKTQANKRMDQILEWVRNHAIDSDITVSSLAEKFAYNRDYLSRFFKQYTGGYLTDYIHMQKMSKAKDMLSRTTLSVKEITYAIGINDERYFMKLFKKAEGITPTEFRKAYFKKHLNKQ